MQVGEGLRSHGRALEAFLRRLHGVDLMGWLVIALWLGAQVFPGSHLNRPAVFVAVVVIWVGGCIMLFLDWSVRRILASMEQHARLTEELATSVSLMGKTLGMLGIASRGLSRDHETQDEILADLVDEVRKLNAKFDAMTLPVVPSGTPPLKGNSAGRPLF